MRNHGVHRGWGCSRLCLRRVQDIEQAKRKGAELIHLFETYMSPHHFTLVLHAIGTHLPEQLATWAPTNEVWMFGCEDYNGYLKKLIKQQQLPAASIMMTMERGTATAIADSLLTHFQTPTSAPSH